MIKESTIDKLADGIREDLAAIDNSDSLTHAIAAGEKLNRAKGLVKHGEWLPWLRENFTLSDVTASKYMRLGANSNRASSFNSIREALDAIPAKQQRTSRKKPKGKDERSVSGRDSKLAHQPEVLDWVRKHSRAGTTSKNIVAKSKSDEDYPGETQLSDGTLASCFAAIAAEERVTSGNGNGTDPKPKKKEPRWSGKRLREINADIKGGDNTQLKKLQKEIAHAVRALEDFSIPDLDWGTGINSELAGFVFDDVAALEAWVNNAASVIVTHMSQVDIHRKIKAAQAIIDDPNASEGYRMAARAGIERLIEKKGLSQ